ncbi:MAG: hypothetical protein U1E62_14510 [Alsobacter sp.]
MTSRWLAALVALGAALALAAPAHAFEDPPVADAEALLGAKAKGPNYRIAPEVRSDGLLRLYVVETRFGTYEVAGDDFLRRRLQELAALRSLQAMSESDIFVKSLGQAAAAPLKYGADLLTDPGATLKRSASGVANLFDRIGAGINNAGSSRDNVVTSILGVDSARRTLAVQLGVDPYTEFPPLAQKLTDVATAAAMGGLSMKGLMMAIPGGAGLAVSSASTANTVTGLLAEKTSSQIIDIVLDNMQRQKVSPQLAQRLVQNRFYTPTDLLLMAHALRTLKASGAVLYVARAADAASRDEAFFQRRRIELIAANAKALGITSFVDVGGFPLNRTADGRLVAVFPLDEVAWTERVARAFTGAAQAAGAQSAPPVLALTGSLTPLAQEEVGKLGWQVQKLN